MFFYLKLLSSILLTITSTFASECLLKNELTQYRCSGTVKVKTISELNNYLTNYGLKKNVIKNLEIDFPIGTGQVFNIHSPCHIKFTSNANIDQSYNLCLYSKEDIRFSENLTINLGGDLKITSEDRIIFLDNLRLNANNVELKSFGTSFESRVRFSKDSTINVQNLMISSNERAVIGENVNVKAIEAIRIYSKQDLTTDTNIEDNIFLRSNSKLEANTIEVQAKSNLRFGSNVLLKASEVILNGKGCTLGKTVVIDSPNKLGNCFLASVGKGWFSADVVKGQKPLTVNFKVNSEKAPVGFYYHWHLGNGDIIKTTTPNLSYTYQNSGVFIARLKIQEQEAYPKKLKDGGSLNIEVSDITNLPPVSMLNCSTNNLLIQCEGLGSYDPEGAPLTYEFIYSDGHREENFTGLSTHSVTSPGLVTVTLKVRDFQGLEAQSIAYAQATLPPNINPVAKVQCESTKPQTLKCNGLGSGDSDGSIILYEYFIDSNLVQSLSNQNEFEIKLSDSGLKTVELKVTDNQGGVGSASLEVSVLENKAPEFNLVASILESEVPYNTIVQVTNISDDSEISEIKLSFSDGEIQFGESVNKLVEEAGELIVTASVTDEFGLVTLKTLTLKGLEKPPVPPKAYFKYNSFQDSYFFLQHFIEVGSSEIAEAYYLVDAGTDHETRIDISDFNVNGLTTYNLGNLEERTITLKVRDEKGLTSEFTHNAELSEDWDNVKPYLDVDLKKTTPRTVLLDFSKSFDLDREWLMSRYEIDYGNGHTQVVEGKQYALYQYPETGNYTIKVRGISERDAVSEKELQVEIDNIDHGILNPKANFTYQIFDIAMHVTFNIDGSVTSNGEILSYEWDFGDGETGLGEKVAHFYEPGIYDVKLTITDSFGLKSSQVQRVTILEGGDDLISFIDCYQRFDAYAECEVMALDKFKEINYLKIDWGDESEKFITEPVTEPYQTYNVGHIFKESGSYEVNYYVGTTRGQVRRETQTIDVEVTDYLGANLQCFVNEMRVTCNALGFYDTHLSNIHYEFDFGDNTVVTNDEGLASHSYAGPGTYQVKLKVTNDSGVEATAERTVMVLDPVGNQAPVARFQCDSYGPLVLRCFDTGSFDPDGIIVEKTITFHDGTSEMLDTPYSFKEYAEAGTYAVTLTLVDDSGLETEVTREFEVRGNNAPVAQFECATNGPQQINCTSNSYDEDFDDQIVEYRWKILKDNELVAESIDLFAINFEKLFSFDGPVTVELNVKDKFGGVGFLRKEVILRTNTPPFINLVCSSLDSLVVSCRANAYDEDGTISELLWSVEDQSYRNQEEIQYKFSDGGIKKISLKAVDNLGVIANSEVDVTINLPEVFTTCGVEKYKINCVQNFSQVEGISITSALIDYEDEFRSYDKESSYEFLKSGTKSIYVKLMRGDELIVSKKLSILIPMQYLSPEPNFTEEYKNGRVISLDASPSLIQDRVANKYKWKIDDKEFETITPVFEHEFASDGNYAVELTVYDVNGVHASITREVYVENMPVPMPDFEIMNSTIKGIDSNSNGLRDDVERFIVGMGGSDQSLRAMLSALAYSHENDLMSGISSQSIKENILYRMKVEECIKEKFGEDLEGEGGTLITILNSAYYNTRERMQNKTAILELAGPMIIEGSMDEETKRTFCGSF